MADANAVQETTPTLDEVVRHREDLYQALLALEQSAARPAAGREDEWLETLVAAVEVVEHEIDVHIEVTERPDGLYADIVEAAPRLSHNVALLRDEHPEMRESVVTLRNRLQAEYPPSVEEARDEVQRLLGRLVKHRQHGADLLWQAYSLDTGGTG
jgi:hypothetical protein